MKYVVFLLTLFAPGAVNAQWSYKGLGGVRTNQLTIDGDSIYASTSDGLFVKYMASADTVWARIAFAGTNVVNTMFTGSGSCISLVDVLPHYTRIHRSNDRGRKFSLLRPDTSEYNIYSWGNHMAKAPLDNDTLYFLQHDLKTYDGGSSWSSLGFTPQANKFLYVAPDRAGEVYAGGENMIFSAYSMKTTDAGGTWTYMDNSTFFAGDNAIHAMRVSGTNVYAAGEGIICRKDRNTPGGWTQIFNAFSSSEWGMYLYGLAMSPVNDSFLYSSGYGNGVAKTKVRLLVSRDRGNYWDSLTYDPAMFPEYAIYDVQTHHSIANDVVWLGGTGVYTYSLPVSGLPALRTTETSGHMSDVTLFPNPVRDELHLKCNSGGEFEIIISDAIGQVVYSAQHLNGSCVLALHHLSNGIYVCQVSSALGVTRQQFSKL